VRSSVHGAAKALDGSAAIVLLVSGLGGGSQGAYVQNMATTLAEQGFAVAVLNMRACAGTVLKTPRLFSAYRGSTDDVRVAVKYVRSVLVGGGSAGADAQVFVLGWSNGGTIVVNTLAEQATREGKGHHDTLTSITAAVALATPHDMVKSTAICEERFLSRWVYNRHVARNIVKQLDPYVDLYRRGPIARWSDDEPSVDIDVDLLLGATRIREIDEAITRRVFGYDSVDDYYRNASSFRRLEHVAAPLLLVSAADDPVSSRWAPFEEVRQNRQVLLAYTEHGGHLGWQDDVDVQRSRWVEEVVAAFFGSVCRHLPEID